MEKETLEQAAERLCKYAYVKHKVKDDKLSLDEQIQRSGGFGVGFKEGFIAGAKWQAKRMYSEEEMKEYAEFCIMCNNSGLPIVNPQDWRKIKQ